jgi:hypothetical protein
LFKICVLAPPLERFIIAAVEALPLARTSGVAWLSLFGFAVQLYLVLSGAVDLWLGFRRLAGMRVVESFGAPFRATSLTGFWKAWAPAPAAPAAGSAPAFAHALTGMTVVLLAALFWRGFSWAAVVWLALHLILLIAETWRGRALFAPLPPPVCAVLSVVLFLFTGPLLFMPGLAAAAEHLQRLYQAPPATAYSVLLDARLTTPWPLTCLWVGGLAAVALPPLRWLLAQPWKVWPPLGLAAGVVALLFVAREWTPRAPASPLALMNHLVQWPLAKGFQEGNSHVFVARDGWLYRQQELDRLTLRRRAGDDGAPLAALAEPLRASQVPLLVIPVPDKAVLYPEPILPGEYHGPVRPAAFTAAVAALERSGATVLDLAVPLWNQKNRRPIYFQRDSHWTPHGMKEAASAAARLVREKWPQVMLDRTPLVDVRVVDHEDEGDLAWRLDPWAPGSLWGSESAHLVAISGLAHQSDSPVLVLGGDLLQVFESSTSSFGDPAGQLQPAGFATQLAALLGRPVAIGPAVENLTPEAASKVAAEAAASRRLVIVLIRAGDL